MPPPIRPKKLPSQVFFGLILGANKDFPKRFPPKYAVTSLKLITKIKYKSKFDPSGRALIRVICIILQTAQNIPNKPKPSDVKFDNFSFFAKTNSKNIQHKALSINVV